MAPQTERRALETLRSVVRSRGLENTIDLLSLLCFAIGEDLAFTGELLSAGRWSDAGNALLRCAAAPAIHEVSRTDW